eukprot:7251981-Prymnesium_polylepis.1
MTDGPRRRASGLLALIMLCAPAGAADGDACTSAYQEGTDPNHHDADTEMCMPWCKAGHGHCESGWCKCKACEFCDALPPASRLAASGSVPRAPPPVPAPAAQAAAKHPHLLHDAKPAHQHGPSPPLELPPPVPPPPPAPPAAVAQYVLGQPAEQGRCDSLFTWTVLTQWQTGYKAQATTAGAWPRRQPLVLQFHESAAPASSWGVVPGTCCT